MLQDTDTACLDALSGGFICNCLPDGIMRLLPGFFTPPVQLTLCVTGAVFLTITCCPSRTAMACGMNAHTGWSSSTGLAGGLAKSGAIGGLPPFASVIHTNTFLWITDANG